MIKHIPNIITSLNLLCGCFALLFAVSGDLIAACFFVFAGMLFDFFDGLAARILKVESKIGLELDSLADMVTFGVVPGIIMVQLISMSMTGEYLDILNIISIPGLSNNVETYLPLIGLLIILASAYRLAKFNVDTRQTDSFIGLPTPANTLLIISLPLIFEYQNTDFIKPLVFNEWVLIAITIISAILLNAEIPLFSLKFKSWDFKSNKTRYVFLILSLITLLLLNFLAIPVIILMYIILSLVKK